MPLRIALLLNLAPATLRTAVHLVFPLGLAFERLKHNRPEFLRLVGRLNRQQISQLGDSVGQEILGGTAGSGVEVEAQESGAQVVARRGQCLGRLIGE